jgi:hypothetical protein
MTRTLLARYSHNPLTCVLNGWLSQACHPRVSSLTSLVGKFSRREFGLALMTLTGMDEL